MPKPGEDDTHHRRKHSTLRALFRTLLHPLMTAQLRVNDLDLDRLLARAGKSEAQCGASNPKVAQIDLSRHFESLSGANR